MSDKVGTSLVLWQIAVCFIAGKALHKMWPLINILQFYVYIGMWQVTYTMHCSVVFRELRRVALGEFMDDLEISGEV